MWGSILKQESILPDLRDLQEQQWFQRQKHACGQTEDTYPGGKAAGGNNSRTDEDGTAGAFRRLGNIWKQLWQKAKL